MSISTRFGENTIVVRFNNFDALEFIDIHKRFNQRSILAEEYLRDELDWIRSRYSKNERKII